eukprot:UN09969
MLGNHWFSELNLAISSWEFSTQDHD